MSSALPARRQAVVVQPEEGDDLLDVGGVADPLANPAGGGKYVMGLGSAFIHELVADLGREREIGEAVSVKMSQLYLAVTKLHPPEAMRMGGDTFPAPDRFFDRNMSWVHDVRNAPEGPAISRAVPVLLTTRTDSGARGR
jgi:hypothetical protein